MPGDGDDGAEHVVTGLGRVELHAGSVETDGAEQGTDLPEHVGRDPVVRKTEHLDLGVLGRVVEHDLEEEPVELRLGKRKTSPCSYGFWVAITRNGSGSLCALPSTVTWRSCIASSSAACDRGGVRLISSASSTFVKTEPGKNLLAHPDRVDAGQLGGRRVGRELDALELRAEHVRRRPREKRLRAAGRALEQDVAASERRDEQQLHRTLLSDDDLRDLGLRALPEIDEAVVRCLYQQ